MIFLMENQIDVILRQLEKDGQEVGNPNFFTRLFGFPSLKVLYDCHFKFVSANLL
ncbi:unknown [Clostridium sp. CAG:568]|nr:unknown [Clostridium sp. CAG:568]